MIRRSISIFILLVCLSIPLETTNASSDKSFTTMRLNKFGSVIIRLGEKFGFDIGGLIKPFFTKEGNIAIPNFAPTADWLDAAEGYMTPQEYIQDGKHLSWVTEIFYTALYGAILKTSAPHGTEEVSPECIISTGLERSAGLPDARRDFENARRVDAWYGINPVDPDDSGVVNFDLPQVALAGMDAGEQCKLHQPGYEQPPVENDLRSFSQFGGPGTLIEGHELETIMIIVNFFNRITGEMGQREEYDKEMHKDDVILTKAVKQLYHSIQCHHGGCPSNEAGEYSGTADVSGGWTAFLLREEDKKPFTPASVQPYDICIAGGFECKTGDFSYDLKNLSDRRTEQAACYVVPDTTGNSYGDVQAVAAVGGDKDRKIDPMCKPKIAQCPIDLIEQGAAKSDGACNLKNTASYTSSTTYLTESEKASLPGGIPPLMIKVLQAAGATYNVPASVLLGTMLEEGSFTHAEVWKWTDDTVKQFSDCTVKDPMPSCEEFAHPTTGAKGPFGFIQNWWENYIESGGPYKAYEGDPVWKEVLASFPKENITQCNFVDAAFTAARELGEDQSHLYVPGIPISCPSSFGTINVYQGGDIPGSCSAWSAERTALARLQYGDRVCDLTVERMVKTYNGFSAGGGNVSF